MKKKVSWMIVIVTILIVIIFISSNVNFVKSEELYGFLVPINAELVQENEEMKGYHWSRVSEVNGIPVDYEISLKINGWKIGKREGACVFYTKGNHIIDLCSYYKEFVVIKR